MTAASPPSPPAAAPAATGVVRAFGRFELRQLLGKSSRTMVWLAFDPSLGQELMLTLPRAQPVDDAALQLWMRNVRAVARLDHPNLAPVGEIGVYEHWPFVAVERSFGITLGEHLATQSKPTPADIVGWTSQVLQGLAFVHDAGMVHGDVQLHTVLVTEQGRVRLMAPTAGSASADNVVGGWAGARSLERVQAEDSDRLRAQREAAQRDVAAGGVLLHGLLAGQPALAEPDTGLVLQRMYPQGHEVLRLPWTTPFPISEALRAIVNRATSSHPRQRYLSARTLVRALQGWSAAENESPGGPLALLLDRLRTVGHLPTLAGVGARIERLVSMEGRHTDDIAEQILKDMALSLELLRQVNAAQVQALQVAGGPPVLTVRRSVALLGLNGVRAAAQSLRRWPGPLSEGGALALHRLMDRVRLAGHTAQALRPPGYDAEVVYIVTLLQSLGRLLVQYHFPDEAEQIRQLMAPLSAAVEGDADAAAAAVADATQATKPGAPKPPVMTESLASYGVLGVDIEAIGPAVIRHWGLGDEMVHMIRRLSTDSPVRTPDTDADMLRLVASAANEAVDALGLTPTPRVAPALAQVAQRYARVLEITPRDLQQALQDARTALNDGTAVGRPAAPPATAAGPGPAAGTTAAPTAAVGPTPGGLRERLRANASAPPASAQASSAVTGTGPA